MSQTSQCNRCSSQVLAHNVSEGRAFYRCSCGKRWSGRAFYGNESCGAGMAIVGGVIGTALTGGLTGGLVGAALGAIFGSDSCNCLRCGGTGYPTGRNGNRKGYQCSNCRGFWTKRV